MARVLETDANYSIGPTGGMYGDTKFLSGRRSGSSGELSHKSVISVNRYIDSICCVSLSSFPREELGSCMQH